MSVLDKIIAAKRLEVAALKKSAIATGARVAFDRGPQRSLQAALERLALHPEAPRIIAEVKKASPSAGLLRADFDPLRLAAEYQAGGAAALSVVTDAPFFQGSVEWLARIRPLVDLPLLRKEFIVDPWQLEESRQAGADAVLLIAAVLSEVQLKDFLDIATELELECLVEIRDLADAAKVAAVKAPLVGINNRDLKDFTIDLKTSIDLAAHLPGDRLIVSESGIESAADIKRLQAAGINAFLIGTSLVKAGSDRLRLLAELQR
ncbi:MAG: indole-3-glycerol phosphate synthase TrpC [Deltaproteobacteria bacterium]|nr:indole-3-glycerol phosphate synthase TrpC [Deltaproteobacteria bacterium]